MAAATTVVVTPGRGPNPQVDVAIIEFTLTASATTYTSASGGLPFDLTAVLQTISASSMQGGVAPNYQQTVNPNDIVGVLGGFQLSTNGFLGTNFALGTPTYTAVPWQSDSGPDATPGILATCPCTIRLYGTGSGNHLALGEIADGAVTDAITLLLVINRNGANS